MPVADRALPLAVLVAVVATSGPVAARSIDLRDSAETKLVSTARRAFMSRVAAGGDVNGDGKADLLVSGAPGKKNGLVRVFFGPIPRGITSLDESPRRGFSIHGADPDDSADEGVTAGDVNGDGLDDVLVGAAEADNNGRPESGSAYVVFGKADMGDVELAAFDNGTQGDAGFRIDGPDTLSLAGNEVGGLGDTDGDGLSEVFVGAVFSGSVYVVRGKADPAPVDLATFGLGIQGPAGYRIDHHVPDASDEYSVVPAGDTNGDGLGDVALATAHESFAYDVWVVFGKADDGNVDVDELGTTGYKVVGTAGNVGMGLSTGGDVNGDGNDDLVIGVGSRNRAFVLFGRKETSTVRLRYLGDRGFRIFGVPRPLRPGTHHGRTGDFVGGGEDVNGDGLSDFLVSAYLAGNRGRPDSGSVYLMFGKDDTDSIRLGRLGRKGIRIDGERRYDHLGIFPAMPGDVTGDGRPDVAIGAPVPRLRHPGQVHVISHRMLFRR